MRRRWVVDVGSCGRSLDWRELGRVEPTQLTVRNVLRRLAGKGDPCGRDGMRRSPALCRVSASRDEAVLELPEVDPSARA